MKSCEEMKRNKKKRFLRGENSRAKISLFSCARTLQQRIFSHGDYHLEKKTFVKIRVLEFENRQSIDFN